MLDFVLGIALAGLLVRGWFRGFVREALDLVGLFAGLWIALRLSGPVGGFLVSTFGVSPELAGIGAGVLLFVLFGVATSIASHYLTRLMKLPGLNLANRVGGAAIATAWGVLLILVAVNVAKAFPLPDSIDDAIEESSVVNAIAGPDALPQSIFDRMAPDTVLSSLASLQSIFGSARAVPEGVEVIDIPPAADDEIRQVRDEAEDVLKWINEYRTGEGLGALSLSSGMADVAESRAVAMYTSGRISRATPPGGNVADDLSAAGIRLTVSGENLALASSARAGYEAILDSPTGLAQLQVSTFDRTGIAVVEGPTGRLLVIVLGG
jgi:membrane protein required for colicin V production